MGHTGPSRHSSRAKLPQCTFSISAICASHSIFQPISLSDGSAAILLSFIQFRFSMIGAVPKLPIKFEPDVERAYALHLLQRFIPLGRLASAIGIIAFIGYGFWDLMLNSDALSKTALLRVAAVLHFAICISVSFLPVIHTSPRIWGISWRTPILGWRYCSR